MNGKIFCAAAAAAALSFAGAASAQTSGVTFERYDNIGGVAVADLTGSPAYQNNQPTSTTTLQSFEIPVNATDNYGGDVFGYFTPGQSGTYFFGVASDDASELYLSTDANPANRQLIAGVTGWGNSRVYNNPEGGSSMQTISNGIDLVGGQSYFIQALVKEGGGGDNLAVTASFGSNTITNGQDPLGAGATAGLGQLTTEPIPEPAGLALLGISGLMLRRRRR